MKNKKMISLVSAVALMATMIQVPMISKANSSFEFNNTDVLQSGTNESNIPTLSLECIERDSDGSVKKNSDGSYAIITDLSTIAVNTPFFVGIRALNFTQFTHNADKFYLWGTGLAYDTEYVTFEPTYFADLGFSASDDPADFITRLQADGEYFTSSRNGYKVTSFATKTTASNAGVASNLNETLAILVEMNNANFLKTLDGDVYLGFVEFKLNSIPSDVSSGKKLFDLSRSDTDTCLQFGSAGDYSYTYNNADSQLEKYLKLDASGVDFFPAGAETLTSIAKGGTLGKALTDYIAGDTFDPSGLTVTPTTTEGTKAAISPTKDNYNGLNFYVAAANNLGDDMSTATQITKDTALTVNDHNDKYVYVAYTVGGVTKAVCLGQLEVVAKSLRSVTNQTTGDNKTTFGTASAYYTGTAIKDILTKTPEKLTVVKGYNNGDTEEIVYSAFGDNGLALYYVDAGGKLQLVGDQTALAEGANTFYVAETGKENTAVAGVTIKAGPYTINAVTDTMILKTATATPNDLTYTEDTTGTHTINFADVVIGYNMSSAPTATPTEKTVSKIGSSKLIFYIGTSNVPADNKYTSGATIDGTAYDADTMAGENKYVYVVPAGLSDYTSVTPVLVGQLKNRAISTSTTDIGTGYAVTGITTDENTQYGAKLGNGAKITVKYDNGNTKELSYSDFATEGITMKIVKADGTEVDASEDTVLTPAMDGGYVKFYYNNNTLIGKSTALTVKKKTVGYESITVQNSTTPEVKKEYDGTTKLAEGDKAKVEFKIDESDLEDADNLSGKLEITGVTYSYNSKNVADANAIVASETTPATATTAGSLAVKASASGSTDAVNKFNANYELAPLTDDNKTVYNEAGKVKITAKELTVNGSKLTIPPIEVQSEKADVEKTITNPLQLTTDNSNIISITDGTTKKTDDVKLTYKYKYVANDVQTPSEKNTDGTYKADKDVEITGTGANGAYVITGDDSGNYDVTNLSITGAKGTVENKKLNTITINTAPTKATYTYPDTKLDLTGIKFNLNYEGATTPTVIDLTQFLTDGGIITVTDAADQSQTITADNAAGVISLPYGETTLNITYSGKNTTTKVTTNKKPIKLSEIKFAASKVYGQDDAAATKTATPPEGAIEAADADAVQFTFDATFADKSAGENKNVTISNVKLVKKGEGTTDPSVNYVIVKDNGDPIAETDTTTITTGVISQGTQTAPAAPTISVDPVTNNIIVGGPLGENIEYSIDGGTTWQSDVTFKGLAKGQPFTVKARVKATEDGNYAPSEPTASEPVTTFKYHVAIYKKNAKEDSEPAYEVYTDTSSAASKTELNALLPKKISNLKEFYTDAPATIKVEYPYTLAAENVLYYTTSSSGGGGGGGSAVTITLDKTSVSGEVGNSEKVTATIKGSTATPKWTTSNEKVATVDENGNITFVGEGKATVKINVSGTVKSVAVTVTAPTATPVPTVEPTDKPTVEPTDKPSEPDTPIIDVNYTKPYASGYEDDTFKPENKITRAELAAMIARLSYGDDLPDGAYVSSFPDIEADAWFNKYVGYLEDKNVLNGYEDGTFRPYDTVTRGEISTVIARAQRYELIPYSGIFADVTDSDWAKDYIQTLASQGIISGYEDGTFGPYSPLSRAEAVTIINNVLAPSTAIVTFTPNDIEGHWAEANIILAVNERMLSGTWSEDLNPVEIPTPEVTEPVEEAAPAPEATEAPVEEAAPVPEATEAPAEEVVPEGELDPTVKDEPAVPVNPEA